MDEVAFLCSLANHPTYRYPYGGVPDFHVDRVCTDPVVETLWHVLRGEKRL